MSGNIKGITIVLEAETKAFKSGLAELNKATKSLQSELRAVDKSLKLDPNNIEILKQKQELLAKAIDETKNKIEVLRAAKAKADEEMKNGEEINQEQYRALQREIANTESYLKRLESQSLSVSESMKTDVEKLVSANEKLKEELEEIEEALKLDPSNVDILKRKQELLAETSQNLTKAVSLQYGELDKLKAQYEDLAKEEGENSEQAKQLKEQISKLNTELSKNQQTLDLTASESKELNAQIEDLENSTNTTNGSFVTMQLTLANLLSTAIISLTKGVKNLGEAFIKTTSSFEASMSEVAAISGATGDELEALTEKAKELGVTTKFTASESAEAFKYMAMAGWDTETMLQAVDGVLNLAAASGTDLATTSDIVTDAMTGFGLSAEETSRFVDVLASASSNANTNVELMGETFKHVSPVAGAMGYNIEDTAVAIGLMANAGIKGSQAGTALRSILSRLTAPTKESSEAINQLGLEITNSDGTMKSLNDILVQIREKMYGLSEAQQSVIAKQLAGQEALSGLLAIVNASEEDFNKLTTAVYNSSGAAQKMSDVMMDNLEGDFAILKSTVEGIALSFGEILLPIIKSVVEKMQSLADWVLNLDDNQKKLLITIPALVTSIGGIVLVGGSAISAINKLSSVLTSANIVMTTTKGVTIALTTAQTALNKAIIGLKSPLGIAITTLALLTVAFKDVEGVGQILKATLTGLIAGFVAFKTVAGIQAIITGVTAALSAQAVATGVATANTTAFNAALYANPIGAIVAGVVALGAALYSLVKAFTKASDEAEEYNKKTEKIIDNTEALIESVEENKSAYEETTKSIEAQIESNKMLYDEIESLVEIEEKDIGQKLLLQSKIDELNSSVEGLSLSYNEETGELNKNSEAVENQLRVQEAQLQLNSGLEEQARIRQELVSVTQANEEALARLAEVTLKLNEDEKLSYGDRKLLIEQQEELKKTIQNTELSIEELNLSYDNIGRTIEENAFIVEEANKAKAESEENYQDAMKETAYVADMVAALDEEAKEKAMQVLEEFTSQATNAFDKINKEASLSVNELVSNITENTKTVEQWTSDLETLMERGVDKAFIQTLQEAGPEMSNTVRNLVNASDEEIKQLNKALTQGSETAVEGMRKVMGLPETINTGSDMIDNVAKGVENNKNLDKASEKSIENAKNTMDKTVDSSGFDTVGKEIVTGVASGIYGNKNIVDSAVRDVTYDIQTTFKKELDIHSPSRVFIALSKYINEGIAQGLEDSANLPEEAMAKICDIIVDSGNEISTGLLSIDKATGQLIYDSTYTDIMKKIDLFEKEKDKRISLLDKGTEATLNAIDKEISATQNAYDIKLKLLEQEYLAKTALIDEESAKQIALINEQIDAINKQKELEAKAEAEEKYKKEYEEKKAILDALQSGTEEYAKAKKELDELVRRREKELLQEKREEEKEALRQQIEEIKSKASEEKENLKSVYEEKKWQLEQQKKDELAYLSEMQECLNNDFEMRKELEEVQTKLKAAENEKRTSKEIKELKRRESELIKSLKNNETEFNKFGTKLSGISKGYGNSLLEGIKSTESDITSYIDSVCDKLRNSINNISFSNSSINGSHRTGLRNVPFDDYNAILHKGEMVLTQPEAERYRQGKANIHSENNPTIIQNFYNVKEQKTAFQMKREVKKIIKTLSPA